MAKLEDVTDEEGSSVQYQEVLGDDGVRHRIPLAHPSTVRNRKKADEAVRKPLVDMGLPPGVQDDVLRAIRKGFEQDDRSGADMTSGEEDEGDDDELEIDGQDENAAELDAVKDPKEEFWDEFFDSLILTVPFSFLYLLLDILVHLQYQFRPSMGDLASHMSRAVPTLGVLVFYTNRHHDHLLTIFLLTLVSIGSGSRLIWLVNKAGWSMTINQAPPMGTLWMLSIVQLPLSRAVLSLVGVAAYTYYTGLKLMP